MMQFGNEAPRSSPFSHPDNFCTFDIIGKLAFSSDFGCLETSKYHPWVRLAAFQQREIETLKEMKRQGMRLIPALLEKMFAKNKQEFLGYTEYVYSICAILHRIRGSGHDDDDKNYPNNKRNRQKLDERIQLGSAPDVMDSFLHNKDGIVGWHSPDRQAVIWKGNLGMNVC